MAMKSIPHKSSTKNQDQTKQYILLGLVCLLLVFSVVQTFQINALEGSGVSGSGSTGINPASAGGSPAPAVSQQRTAPVAAPTMVGGC